MTRRTPATARFLPMLFALCSCTPTMPPGTGTAQQVTTHGSEALAVRQPTDRWSDLPLADGFDYPVGPPDAQGYYDAQPFGVNAHLGSDWNGTGGGDSDLGDPIFAIADGEVTLVRDVGGGWGKLVRIAHRYDDQGAVDTVESLYAHLDEHRVAAGDRVSRGDRIGTMGNAGGRYPAHLHFELRSHPQLPLGRGYGAPGWRYLDPTAFIEAHRPSSSMAAREP